MDLRVKSVLGVIRLVAFLFVCATVLQVLFQIFMITWEQGSEKPVRDLLLFVSMLLFMSGFVGMFYEILIRKNLTWWTSTSKPVRLVIGGGISVGFLMFISIGILTAIF